MANFVTVATVDQLTDGERIVAEIGDLYVAVFRVDGRYYAIEDICTHDDGPLAEGDLVGDKDNPAIECPRHGATFNLKTGKTTLPAVYPVARYAVRVEGNDVQVDVETPLA
jgi:3-phenylpropionate/trans-cinnamate dioxygenase ferredoxin component